METVFNELHFISLFVSNRLNFFVINDIHASEVNLRRDASKTGHNGWRWQRQCFFWSKEYFSFDAILGDNANAANTTRASIEEHRMQNCYRIDEKLVFDALMNYNKNEILTFAHKFYGIGTRHLLAEKFPNETMNIGAARTADGVAATNAHTAKWNLIDLPAVLFIPAGHDDASQQLVSVIETIILDFRCGLFHQWFFASLIPETKKWNVVWQ